MRLFWTARPIVAHFYYERQPVQSGTRCIFTTPVDGRARSPPFSVTPICATLPQNGRKMMARRIAYSLISVFGVLLAIGSALGAGMMTFTSEQKAQQHCPSDTVVWLNTTNATYPALQRARWRAIARHSTACFWLATSSAHRAQSTTAESKLSVREASAQGNPSEFDREFTTRNPQPMSALPPYPHQFILQRPILTRLAGEY